MQIQVNYIYICKILHNSLKTSILYTYFCALLFFPLTVYLREFPTSLNKSFFYSFFRIHGGHDWATFTHSLTHTFSIVWMEYNWFNHLSIKRHWSCFQSFINTNDAAMKNLVLCHSHGCRHICQVNSPKRNDWHKRFLRL